MDNLIQNAVVAVLLVTSLLIGLWVREKIAGLFKKEPPAN